MVWTMRRMLSAVGDQRGHRAAAQPDRQDRHERPVPRVADQDPGLTPPAGRRSRPGMRNELVRDSPRFRAPTRKRHALARLTRFAPRNSLVRFARTLRVDPGFRDRPRGTFAGHIATPEEIGPAPHAPVHGPIAAPGDRIAEATGRRAAPCRPPALRPSPCDDDFPDQPVEHRRRSSDAVCTPRTGRTTASLGRRLAVSLRSLTSPDRLLPISVATIVAVASLSPSCRHAAGRRRRDQGSGTDTRLAVNGGVDVVDPDRDRRGRRRRRADRRLRRPRHHVVPAGHPPELGRHQPAGRAVHGRSARAGRRDAADRLRVDTPVEDGAHLIERYKVKSGDTLVEIAHHFDVSMMTLWWANKLKSKDDLQIGQTLRDPAGERARRHGRGERHPGQPRRPLQGGRGRHRRPQRPRPTRSSSSARCSCCPAPRAPRSRRPKPTPKRSTPARAARPRRRRRRPGRRPLHRRPDPLARHRRRQLHQPVLPLRPRGAGHRGGLRDARRSPRPAAR